ncbi:hypothetical protein NM688_g8551 [Phlebia brevispora]|uniref:Uncharacterized protein n=1 Tax=Phlebia brevispora TaxID=194682 RepID=A0ACC1RS04_9APHY|nr:hypothetical protein NM688_g8551 [Phlebia brevispora]
MTKFTKHRIGLAGASGFHHKRADSSCSTGGFYKSPSVGQTISSSDALNITWDTTCMSTDAVDIYLYAPGASKSLIHLWETVAFAPGSYQTSLMPKWWNATSSVNLQLSIIQSGMPPYMQTIPAGPIFTATYTAPTSGSTPADADTSIPDSTTQVVNNLPKSNHLSKGKVAAAVIMPLLIVIAILAAVYIKRNRRKVKEDRKRFSQAVDTRMSMIATDWKSLTPGGAQAAIRSSIAVDGNRASSFSFGAIRPASTVALESGQAGIGTQGVLASGGIDTTTPQMTQLRSGPRVNPMTGERISRVSFAADVPRAPAVHSTPDMYPPLPSHLDSDDGLLSPGGAMSPTQAAGPLSLTAEDINARMAGQETTPRPSVDEVLPALTRMLLSPALIFTEKTYRIVPLP